MRQISLKNFISQRSYQLLNIDSKMSLLQYGVTQVNLSFCVHLRNYNKQQLILAKFYTNNAPVIGT